MEGCREYGMPEPIIKEEQGGLTVTFLKEIYSEEYLKTLDLNERQIKAELYIKEHGEINNSKYQKINGVKQTISSKELSILVQKDILTKKGTKGRSIAYTLKQ